MTADISAPLHRGPRSRAAAPRRRPLRIARPRTLLLAAFLYVLLRPVSNNDVLLPALAVAPTFAAARLIRGRARLHPLLWPVVAAHAALTLIGVTGGYFGHTPGLAARIGIYCLCPAAAWLCVAAADLDTIRRLINLTIWATVALSATLIVYVLESRHLAPPILPLWLLEQSGSGFAQTTVETTAVRFYGLSTLVAAGPLAVASTFMPTDGQLCKMSTRVLAAGGAAVAALVAGRQALLVVIVLSVPVALWLRRLLGVPKPSNRRLPTRQLAAAGALLLVAATVVAGITSTKAATDAANATFESYLATSGGDTDARLRRDQAGHLLTYWAATPLSVLGGNGFGAVLPDGYTRSDERPWDFELQYHLLLCEAGAVGVGALGLAAYKGLAAVRKAARRMPAARPLLCVSATGAVAMLVANASNPYLQAPGHLWAIYLPLAAANAALVSADRERTRPVI